MTMHSPDRDFRIFVRIMILFLLPVTLTFLTIVHPGSFTAPHDNPTPYGYSISLLIFLIPVGALFTWFFKTDQLSSVDRKSFWITVAAFTIAGFTLDTFLGNTLFEFKNTGAILAQSSTGKFPLHIWGYDFSAGKWLLDIPIEEFLFYFLGSLYMLLAYVWADKDWIDAYGPRHDLTAHGIVKLIKLHGWAFVWYVVAIVLAILYKRYGNHAHNEGLPIYFMILATGFLLPTMLVFKVIKPHINWRALSACTFTLTFVSVLWEGVLGVPYEWWNYDRDLMVGIFIGSSRLPVEAVCLWFVAGWGVVNLFEALRIHFTKGTSTIRQTLFGTTAP